MPRSNGLFASVVTGLALTLLLATVGVTVYGRDHALRSRGVATTGTVVSNVEQDGALHPVVRFHDADGHLVVVAARAAHEVGSRPVFHAGERVSLVYDPADPGSARIESIFHRFVVPTLCLLGAVLGLVFFVLGPWQRTRRDGAATPDATAAA